MDYEKLKHRLTTCINPDEDSLRIYRLPTPKEDHIEHFGVNEPIDFDGPLVI
jgi:CRISPR-associated protein Cas2